MRITVVMFNNNNGLVECVSIMKYVMTWKYREWEEMLLFFVIVQGFYCGYSGLFLFTFFELSLPRKIQKSKFNFFLSMKYFRLRLYNVGT